MRNVSSVSAKTAAKYAARFTEAELKAIGSAAQAVWQEIGGDCLLAMGEGEAATFDRATVIELVLDASRLEEQLRRTARRGKDPVITLALVTRVEKDIYEPKSQVERFLTTDVFKARHYGF